MTLTIAKLSSENQKLWTKLHNEVKETNLFSSKEWMDIVLQPNEIVDYYLIHRKGQIIGGFPLVHIQGRILLSYSHPTLTPHLGPIFKKGLSSSIKRSCIEKMAEFMSQLRFDSFKYPLMPELMDVIPFKRKNFIIEPNFTYQIDLTTSEEAIHKNLASDKKRNIKKARKQGVSVSFEQNPKVIIDLISKTYSRQSKKNNWITVAKRIMYDYPNTYQVVSYLEDNPVAGIFVVHNNQRAYYLFGGYDDAIKNYTAGPFAMWNAILHAKKLKLKIFDFEGSELPAIENYFRRFGGELTPYFSIHKVNRKQKIINLFR